MKAYRHILLATDFSEYAEMAALRATDLARHHQARLTLLHVVEYFPEDIPIEWIPPEDTDPAGFLTNRARGLLAQLAKRLQREDAAQEVVRTTRSAKHEIVHFAEQREVDLIVVGTHGRRGIAALWGSTANGVLHRTSCDVLAVHAQRAFSEMV